MTSNPQFGAETTGTEVAEAYGPQIRGKVVVITGVSPKSLGETLALRFAEHNPYDLVLVSRTRSQLDKVQRTIQQATGIVARIIICDLSSQMSIHSAANSILNVATHIDILVNNAAVVSSDRRETVEGIELQFGVNHIGHFLLTNLLMPKLLASSSPRVVNVSSLGYICSPVRFHDYNFQVKEVPAEELPPSWLPKHFTPNAAEGRPYFVFCAYGQSKTANILHAVSLNDKYGKMGLRAYAVHPGTIDTDLSRNLTPEDVKIIEGTAEVWKNHDQGVATTLVAALDPKLSEATGNVFLSDCQFFTDLRGDVCDRNVAETLWKLSESLVSGQAKL